MSIKNTLTYYYKDGEVILLSNPIDLKIDTKRQVYVKEHDEEDSCFKSVSFEVPRGMKGEEKLQYLMSFRIKMIERMPDDIKNKYKLDNSADDLNNVNNTNNNTASNLSTGPRNSISSNNNHIEETDDADIEIEVDPDD